jgi:quercetin dioxygenase-like cupin family protein
MKTAWVAHAAASVVLASVVPASAWAADTGREQVVPAFAYPIANVPGKSMTALTVTYAPGAKSSPHRHGRAFVVGYVLEGAIRSKVDNGDVRIYRTGESWSEEPGAHHVVSENASATEPAKLLAIFTADTSDKELVTFDQENGKK